MTTFGRVLPTILAGVLVASLLLSALPAFNGGVESQYFDKSLKGYWIPQDYSTVRDYLYSHPGSVLLLPGSATYIQTSWGYQGSSSFYNAYFSPVRIYTSNAFGGGYASASSISAYFGLTQPVVEPSNDVISIGGSINISSIAVYNAPYSRDNENIEISSSNSSSPVQVVIPLSRQVNISGYSYLRITFPAGNTTLTSMWYSQHQFWVGLVSNSTIGWYALGSSQNSFLQTWSNGTVGIFLKVNSPDKPWSGSTYDSSTVSSIILQFPVSHSMFEFALPSLGGVQGYTIDPAWFKLLQSYGIHYLFVDRSLVEGNLSSYEYLSELVNLSIASGDATIVYNGGLVTLLQLDTAR